MVGIPLPVELLSPHFDTHGPEQTIVEEANALQYDDADLITAHFDLPDNVLRVQLARLEAQRQLKWLERVPAGAYRVYHIGNLVVDRETDKHADLLAQLMLCASNYGLVVLVQKRFESMMEYYAYRTGRGLTASQLHNLRIIIETFK